MRDDLDANGQHGRVLGGLTSDPYPLAEPYLDLAKGGSFPVYFNRGHIKSKLATRFHSSGDSDFSKETY